MPTCKHCENHFPNYTKIDGKRRNLSSRKYCLECSPFGQHNTKPIGKRLKDFTGDLTCQTCKREYTPKRYTSLTQCGTCVVNDRRHKQKRKMVDYKGGECIKCGYNRNIKALQFHHRNPEEKEFAISGSHCRKWETLQKELDKCDMLCANCHLEEHDVLL